MAGLMGRLNGTTIHYRIKARCQNAVFPTQGRSRSGAQREDSAGQITVGRANLLLRCAPSLRQQLLDRAPAQAIDIALAALRVPDDTPRDHALNDG